MEWLGAMVGFGGGGYELDWGGDEVEGYVEGEEEGEPEEDEEGWD